MLTMPAPPTSMSPPPLQLLLLPFMFFFCFSLFPGVGRRTLISPVPCAAFLFFGHLDRPLFAALLYFKIMSISFELKARIFSALSYGPGMSWLGHWGSSRMPVPELAAKGRAFKLIVC